MNHDDELKEYFVLNEMVTSFDQRLLTVKGWGVTLSLVALGLGFQNSSFGMFLVSAVSSVAFWWLEAAMKSHQMRFYPRLREIEVNRYSRASAEEKQYSAPRMNWGWVRAKQVLLGRADTLGHPGPAGKSRSFNKTALLPHVMMPHAITLLAAGALFFLCWSGVIQGFDWGSPRPK
jgi:hypothetical protein